MAGSSNMTSQSKKTVDKGIYIYKMPDRIQKSLCENLDRSEVWEKLADHMGYKESDKEIFKSQQSPTEELFAYWGEQNHTVTELFMLLYRLKQYVAMKYMRDLVDPRYHRLIPNVPEENECDMGNIPQIPYAELTDGTNNWSENNVLGKGGFGKVFKGTWNRLDLAVKVLKYDSSDPIKNRKQRELSLKELRFLDSYRHENILPLYGYSVDDNGSSLCLVSELMVGGTLEKRLRSNDDPLNLFDRLTIASGTARGLLYLHQRNPPLIHGDIKTANILLDPHNRAKICDFGLARERVINVMKVSQIMGTLPYLPTEYIKTFILTTKIDSYSFGVVLYEIATGLRAYHKERGMLTSYIRELLSHRKLVELMDKRLKRDEAKLKLGTVMIVLGQGCTRDEADERHEMVYVFDQLTSALDEVAKRQ